MIARSPENAISRDIAVVGWAQTEMVRHTDKSETELLMEVITDVLTQLDLTRADIDFTWLCTRHGSVFRRATSRSRWSPAPVARQRVTRC